MPSGRTATSDIIRLALGGDGDGNDDDEHHQVSTCLTNAMVSFSSVDKQIHFALKMMATMCGFVPSH